MKSPTIDPQEVAYYDRLAEQWWDRQGKFWPLHRLNELRVEYLKNSICLHFGRCVDTKMPLRGLDIIDIGCGGGILSESLVLLGANVHGIDVVEKSINVARQHSQEAGLAVTYEQTTVEALVDREKRYDVVLNMEVVEHVANLPVFMSACTGLLATDGIMYVATINRNLPSWLFAIIGAEYILRWLPRGTHAWRKFVKPRELNDLLGVNGLQVIHSTGIRVNPVSRRFSLGKSLAVNYLLDATRVDYS